jgi:thiol-disulfide isomerase/thioredoxin
MLVDLVTTRSAAPHAPCRLFSRLLAWLVAALTFACLPACGASRGGESAIPDDATTTVVSIARLDRVARIDLVARTLIKIEGVYRVVFDRRRVELVVVTAPNVAAFELVDALVAATPGAPLELVDGPGKGSYVPWQAGPEGADVREVTKDGEDVADLTPHLAPGKVTVVDFAAKWCEPCRAMDAHVLARMEGRTDLAYRKLDVGDWTTPLARRYLTHAKQIPHVWVFDKQGKRVGVVSGLDLDTLDELIDRAATSR